MERWADRCASGGPACRADNADARLQGQPKTDYAPDPVPGALMRRSGQLLVWIFLGIALAGYPKKGGQDFKSGERALDLKDYDAAVDYYSKALQAEPNNAAYRIKLNQSRFEAGQFHIHQGVKLRDKGDIQSAISEFQRATILDPSSIVADQELKKSLESLAERTRTGAQQEEPPIMENGQPALASAPPELKPL